MKIRRNGLILGTENWELVKSPVDQDRLARNEGAHYRETGRAFCIAATMAYLAVAPALGLTQAETREVSS